MLNEILTGKATLEPPPPPISPYREPSVPELALTCATCSKTFRAKAGSETKQCPTCYLSAVEASAAAQGRALSASLASSEARARNRRTVQYAIMVLVVCVLGFLNCQLRQEQIERAAKHEDPLARFRSEYSERLATFAGEMCSCQDLACAHDVERSFTAWWHTPEATPGPDDDDDYDEREAKEYADCLSALEAAH